MMGCYLDLNAWGGNSTLASREGFIWYDASNTESHRHMR
ncbi:hypothetical protein MANES_08G112901v8 [Manihot esculenta]|uniref:Uncharacterized protein n=1 Tax=Manihot esculenta TaxID=3983 RepID=A0ACB7HC64_MANES|nr:hypothetical protein MANES_08G112901v8 [Manihot esculenta]